MIEKVWSVSSLVSYIKRGIDHDENLMSCLVQGELSNVVKHRSGHIYFTLKDQTSRMSCVLFASYARFIHFDLKDGCKVIAHCKVGVYEASGSVQLYVNGLQLDGIGDLFLQFEALKKKLSFEGYFDESHKKAIPTYPMDIAIVSANLAAALSDVKTTLNRRWPIAGITLYPCLVQGVNASQSIIKAIQDADSHSHDIILVVRGGGSLEDLWAFNNEELAKCIYHTNTPIITGVGHESDTTLVDYVSDARAATPTAAAQLATPDMNDVLNQLTKSKKMIVNLMTKKINTYELMIDRYLNHPYFKNPMVYVENNVMNLDIKRHNLENYSKIIFDQKNELNQSKQKMIHFIQNTIQQNSFEIETLKNKSLNSMNLYYTNYQNHYLKQVSLLDAYSPLKILLRGYSLTKVNDSLIQSVEQINIHDELKTIVSDGEIISKVITKEKVNG